MQEPGVQSTIERWSGEVDVTNPRVSGLLGTILELRADGVITRGEMQGSRTGGLDPALLKELIEMANERRIDNGEEPLPGVAEEIPVVEPPVEPIP